jgi:hypothetical protein
VILVCWRGACREASRRAWFSAATAAAGSSAPVWRTVTILVTTATSTCSGNPVLVSIIRLVPQTSLPVPCGFSVNHPIYTLLQKNPESSQQQHTSQGPHSLSKHRNGRHSGQSTSPSLFETSKVSAIEDIHLVVAIEEAGRTIETGIWDVDSPHNVVIYAKPAGHNLNIRRQPEQAQRPVGLDPHLKNSWQRLQDVHDEGCFTGAADAAGVDLGDGDSADIRPLVAGLWRRCHLHQRRVVIPGWLLRAVLLSAQPNQAFSLLHLSI